MTYLLSGVLTIFLKPLLLTMFSGHIPLAKWNVIAWVISVSLWAGWIRWCAVKARFHRHLSYVGRLTLAAIALLFSAFMHSPCCTLRRVFWRSLHMISSRLTSIVLNLKCFQTTDDPLWGTSLSPQCSAMHLPDKDRTCQAVRCTCRDVVWCWFGARQRVMSIQTWNPSYISILLCLRSALLQSVINDNNAAVSQSLWFIYHMLP